MVVNEELVMHMRLDAAAVGGASARAAVGTDTEAVLDVCRDSGGSVGAEVAVELLQARRRRRGPGGGSSSGNHHVSRSAVVRKARERRAGRP